MATILSWTTKGGDFLVVQFDVVTTYTPEGTNSITTHPVELGAATTDHSRPEKERIAIEGYISGKPLLSNAGQTSSQDAVSRLLTYAQMPLDLPAARSLTATQRVQLDPPQPPIQKNIAGLVGAGIGALFSTQLYATVADYANGSNPAIQATTIQAKAAFFDRAWNMWEVLTQARKEASLITVESSLQFMTNMMIQRVASPRTVQDGSGASFQLELERVRIVQSATVGAPVPAEVRGQPPVSKGSQSAKEASDEAKKKASLAVGGIDGLKSLIGL